MEQLNIEQISRFIAKTRKDKDLSQSDLADFLGVSTRTIRHWEKGESIPSMQDVANLCKLFNISLEELYEGKTKEDKFFDTEISKFNTSVEQINKTIASTQKHVNDIDNKVERLYTKISSDNHYVKLHVFGIHIITSLISFLLWPGGTLMYPLAVGLTLIYVIVIGYVIARNRGNESALIFMLYYFAALTVNAFAVMLLWSSSFPFFGYLERFVVNGSMYGLIVLKRFDIIHLMNNSIIVYLFRIALCSFLLHKSKKHNIE